MPSLNYLKHKAAIYKWIKNNRHHSNQIQYKSIRRRRAFQKQARIFRNILIDYSI